MKRCLAVIMSVLMTVLPCTGVFAAEDDVVNVYTDVPSDQWYAEYILDCYDKGLMVGFPENKFEPELALTRAMFLQSLYSFYLKNVNKTTKDLNRLGGPMNEIGGLVGVNGEMYADIPFFLIASGCDENGNTWVSTSTKDEVMSGGSSLVYNVEKEENGRISFCTPGLKLTLFSGDVNSLCDISLAGGFCRESAYKGKAKSVTVSADTSGIKAETGYGVDFELRLCDLGSRTQVTVKGKSSGRLKASLDGYDLTVSGAIGEYTVEVYRWVWKTDGPMIRSYKCSASTESSNAVTFADLRDDAYYIEAVKWAAMRGITSGKSTLAFAPDDIMTRQEMAMMIDRFINQYRLYCKYADKEITILYDTKAEPCEYKDGDDIAEYAKQAVWNLSKAGIMVGNDNGEFLPESATVRCEAAAVLSSFYGTVHDALGEPVQY